MQMNEKSMELAGDLFQEFEETKKVGGNDEGVPYSTWSKMCSMFLTIICC